MNLYPHFKRWSALSLLLALTLALTGCLLQFDAARYTKACLDLITKGETKEYAEMTKQTEKEAAEWYESFLDQEVESMTASLSSMTDEQKQKFRTLFQDIYKNAKYEVGEATRNDDKSYSVPVQIEQYQIFTGAMSAIESDLASYYSDQLQAGNTPTEDELTNEAVELLYTYLSDKLANPSYAAAQEYTIQIQLGSDNKYSISESDYSDLLQKLFDVDALTQESSTTTAQ